jgi:hypothetical protein
MPFFIIVFRPGMMSRSLSESDLSELDGMEVVRHEESLDTLPSSGRLQHLQTRLDDNYRY